MAAAGGSVVETLSQLGLLGPLDVRFARALGRLGAAGEPVTLGAALACRAVAAGDVGVDLNDVAATLARSADAPLPALPEAGVWAESLARCTALVRGPAEERPAPLVLHGTDLYLERTWAYQTRLAAIVRARLAAPHQVVDAGHLAQVLSQLDFGDERAALQMRAAVTATFRGLSLVAGGPGTGKTAVVVKLLALLQALETARLGRPLRVRLVAPTGKAAARMSESIRQRAEQWVPVELRAGLALQASTIHRLLGWRADGFAHHEGNPLPLDLLIVDEASMVDLPLMTKLLDAVAPSARVLLLGDPDQLASVELGSVFADLCKACRGPVSRSLWAGWAAAGCDADGVQVGGDAPRPGDALTVLTHTWRYPAGSGIERLAQAVNAGDADGALAALRDPALPDVALLPVEGAHERTLARVEALVLDAYAGVAHAPGPADALDALRSLRVLGAHRDGRLGVNALDAHLEGRVRQRLGVAPSVDWYVGRPVMVTRNDHDLSLYNGDVGVVLGTPGERERLRVWFETAERERPRPVPPALLPEHDTVFVTTVHKSQGSEHAHVVLVLPAQASPLVTRELLYTAVTRASERVTVLADEAVWRAGVGARINRMSRLAAMCAP